MGAAPPPSHHRGDIEGLRAIAVALVLAYHAGVSFASGGFIGVDVFFVLSGFLITRSLMSEAEQHGRIDLPSFYARRARRLLPASVLVLAATAVGVRALLPVTMWKDFGGDVIASAAYVVNWRLASRSVDYLAEGVVTSPVQHFWSLAIEEQYYFLWPLLIIAGLVVAARGRWRLGGVLAVLLVLVVLVPSITWSVRLTSSEPARAFFDTGTRLWELGIGALAAIAAPQVATWGGRRSRTLLRAAGLGTILLMAVVIDETSPWPGWSALGVVLPTAVVVLAGGTTHDGVDRLLGLRPLQRMGALSYSLYLWHWPPLAILSARWGGLTTGQALAITGLSFLPAWLSYTYVENPLRYRPSLRASPRRSLGLGGGLSIAGVAAGIAVVIAIPEVPDAGMTASAAASDTRPSGAQALSGGAQDADLLATLGPASDGVTPLPAHAAEDRPRTYADGCHVRFPYSEPIVCVYGIESSDVHVAVVGDSKAGQWINAIEELGLRHGWRISNITKSSCALSTTLQEHDHRPFQACLTWNQRVLQLLADDPPDLVITSQGVEQAYPGEAGAGRDVMLDGMLDTYRRIEDLGSNLLVLTDNPNPPIRIPECVVTHPDDLRRCAFDRSEARSGRDILLEAARAGNHDVVDTREFICPTATCLPVIGDVLVYRDSHLTSTYVQTTVSALEPGVLDALGR